MALPFPLCRHNLAPEISNLLTEIGLQWASHSERPTPAPEMLARWDTLIVSWLANESLPLFVRKVAGNRGSVLRHVSGRLLIPTDNSPAHWSYSLACTGVCPTVEQVKALLDRDQIPVAMILGTAEKERARYRQTLGRISSPNAAGWKLAHIEEVGLGSRGSLEGTSLESLKVHFRAFLSPSNMFVVPVSWAGLAEVPEVVSAIKSWRNGNPVSLTPDPV